MAFKILRPYSIPRDIRIKAVLVAIDLDDQLRAETAEVGDVGSDRNLPAEVRTLERKALAQMPP